MKTVQRALISVGVLAMAYAVYLALRSPDFHPLGEIPFLAVVLIAHDGLLLPAAIVLAAALGRFVPQTYRGVIYLALFSSLVVSLFALPFALGHGRRTDTPSALPLNYSLGLLICLALIWAAAISTLLVRALGVHRRSKTTEPADTAPAAGHRAEPQQPINVDPPER
jgi:predicted neutral ceramidase superfamily lipid hydrolase